MNAAIKPKHPAILRANVLENAEISPNIRRITITGEQLEKFTYLGADQWFRFFFPRPDQKELHVPHSGSSLWYAHYLRMSEENRPFVRNYTVRAFRERDHTPELDIDFVIHSSTPASTWATHAQAGDEVGILDQGLYYQPPADTTEQLIVVDETGFPALMGILETREHTVPTHIFCALPEDADMQEVPDTLPKSVNIEWVAHDSSHSDCSFLDQVKEQLKHNISSASFVLRDSSYAFTVGESSLVTGLRRFLVRECKIPKNNVTFVGYWRCGKSQDD